MNAECIVVVVVLVASALSGLRLGLVALKCNLALKADLLAAASFFMSATLILAPRPRKWPAGCGNSHPRLAGNDGTNPLGEAPNCCSSSPRATPSVRDDRHHLGRTCQPHP